MNHSIADLTGHSLMRGIFVPIARISHADQVYFHCWNTRLNHLQFSVAPLLSILKHAKTPITNLGLNLEDCNYRVWFIGPLDQHLACDGIRYKECTQLAEILATRIRGHFQQEDHQMLDASAENTSHQDTGDLQDYADILFKEFLQGIAPQLMDELRSAN